MTPPSGFCRSPDRGGVRACHPPRCPFDTSIMCASSWAMHASRPISTGTPSASTWWPTGARDGAGYVLRQGEITLVLASPLRADHPDNARLAAHGDGVQDIALEVDNVAVAYEMALRRGAIGVTPPAVREDGAGAY